MSQRLLESILEHHRGRDLCDPAQKWLLSLPDGISAQEAYNQCPNWTWIDFITCWFIKHKSEEIEAAIDELEEESRELDAKSEDEYSFFEERHLPKEINDKFRQIYSFREFSADFPTIVELFDKCKDIRPQETNKTESRGISDSGVTF